MARKPSSVENGLMISWSVLLLAGVFHEAMKLPDIVGTIFDLAAGVCVFVQFRIAGRRKLQDSDQSGAVSTAGSRTNRLWLFIAVYAIACALGPFVLPYSGVNLPFPQLVIVSIISFLICVTITIVPTRRQQ